jgi:16S rRNA (uracil1498-N3)-methyltransferase
MARRLYCPQITTGTTIIIGPEAHHARDVLRLKPGEAIEVFDGAGHFAPASVERIAKSQLEVRVEKICCAPLPSPRIVLATAIPKFAHQETLVRMGTELGVSVFYPVICERSSVREQFRAEKWHRWTVEACKQSGNNFLPEVKEAAHFKDVISTIGGYDLAAYGDTEGGQSPEAAAKVQGANNVLIFVGPEGGFTDAEGEVLGQAGAVAVRIGRNILRIETAAVALCALVTAGSGLLQRPL